MKVGPGAEQIEFVAFSFEPDIRVAALRKLIDHTVSVVTVNRREVARAPLFTMPVNGLACRFVHSIGYRVTEGDDVVVVLEGGEAAGVAPDGGLTITAELSILGRTEAGMLARWLCGRGVTRRRC